MGLIDQLNGTKVCIDTAPFIYFIEEHPVYLDIVKPVFASIDAGNIEALTSTVTLLEVLVHPFRMNNELLAGKYRKILLFSEGVTTVSVTDELSETAAKLRAKYSIKSPDALQLATGIFFGADIFLTNDRNLKNIDETQVVVLEDFID
ncbi:MAG: type II toxin-antitoxin system VapC family toxin [Desulfococcaceae bacterium]